MRSHASRAYTKPAGRSTPVEDKSPPALNEKRPECATIPGLPSAPWCWERSRLGQRVRNRSIDGLLAEEGTRRRHLVQTAQVCAVIMQADGLQSVAALCSLSTLRKAQSASGRACPHRCLHMLAQRGRTSLAGMADRLPEAEAASRGADRFGVGKRAKKHVSRAASAPPEIYCATAGNQAVRLRLSGISLLRHPILPPQSHQASIVPGCVVLCTTVRCICASRPAVSSQMKM